MKMRSKFYSNNFAKSLANKKKVPKANIIKSTFTALSKECFSRSSFYDLIPFTIPIYACIEYRVFHFTFATQTHFLSIEEIDLIKR